MAINLKDSKDIFDIWRLANKYNCDEFHRLLLHKIRKEKYKTKKKQIRNYEKQLGKENIKTKRKGLE